jgi:hypothetical protein
MHGKGKVAPVLNSATRYEERVVEVYLHTFLILARDGGKWSVSHIICFITKRQRSTGNPKTGLDEEEE